MKNILIILVIFSNFLFSIELHRTNAIVVDDKNNLLWQDNSITISKKLSQTQANKYCNRISYNGLTGWRLPTIDEYKSIVNKENTLNYINKAFKYNVPSGYWSSDTLLRMLGYYGYYMNFTNGVAYYENKTYKKYVRCVRDTK